MQEFADCSVWDITIPLIGLISICVANAVIMTDRVKRKINPLFRESVEEERFNFLGILPWILSYSVLCVAVMDLECSGLDGWESFCVYFMTFASLMCLVSCQVVYILEYCVQVQVGVMLTSILFIVPMMLISYNLIVSIVGFSIYCAWLLVAAILACKCQPKHVQSSSVDVI